MQVENKAGCIKNAGVLFKKKKKKRAEVEGQCRWIVFV